MEKPEKLSLALILTMFFIWWFGIGGSDLYTIPGLILLIHLGILIKQGDFYRSTASVLELLSLPRFQKKLIAILIAQALAWFLVIVFRYFSFNIWTLDAGLHSNIIFNMANGEFYSSFLNINNLGDHLTPGLALISLLYKITPHILWMMGAKTLAFVFTPVLIYKLCLRNIKDPKKAQLFSIVLGFLWLFFYAPGVNAMRYEFHASALTPPIILYAFLSWQNGRWFRFWLSMILMLTFKEHLGVVWIGFGLYGFLQTSRRKLSVLLIVCGILSIYVSLYHLMPYFRDYQASWSGIERVQPFKDIPAKALYVVKILLPLFFVPLIFWKNGIMAGPAIGINLISGMDKMYSAHYHYDDVSTSLLFIAVILSIQHLNPTQLFDRFGKMKIVQVGCLLWLVCFLAFIPHSTGRFLKKAFPTTVHFDIAKEISKFDHLTKGHRIAVQDVIGPRIFRREIKLFVDHPGGNCAKENSFGPALPFDYVALAPELSNYMIDDMEKCLQQIKESKHYIPVEGFSHLKVFKTIK